MYYKILSIAVGGFIGSISRYALNNWVIKKTESTFPFMTILVNITGSLLLGAIVAFNSQYKINQFIYLLFTAGFAGAFTTFSTAMYELYKLVEDKEFKGALFYFIYTMAGGIIASTIGYWFTVFIL